MQPAEVLRRRVAEDALARGDRGLALRREDSDVGRHGGSLRTVYRRAARMTREGNESGRTEQETADASAWRKGQCRVAMIDRYRTLYEHEKYANEKMLEMLASVPVAMQGDDRYARALAIAAHLAACREIWLGFMEGGPERVRDWWPPVNNLAALRTRFAALEQAWTAYLASLDDVALEADFEFEDNGRWAIRRDIQVEQLVGHAAYHRGQVALLVDQLGGQVVDTDYVDWAISR